MKKKPIILRADGNSEIGFGHVIRSLALAEMLKDEFNCKFATRFLTDFLKKEIDKNCFKIYQLSSNYNNHYQDFITLLTGNEIVVLDNYFYSTEYQKEIKKKGCKLVCIDDLAEKHFVADAIINHSPGITELDYSCESYTKFGLGFDFTLIRNEFLTSNKAEKEIIKFKKAFLSLGGSDFNNLTEIFFEYLLETGIEEIIIVSNSMNIDKVINRAKKYGKKIQIFSNVDAKKMTEILDYVDVAIVPSSTLSFEVVSRNTPLITGYFVDNQENIYEGLLKHKQIKCVGDLNKLKMNDFVKAFNNYEKEVKLMSWSYGLITRNIINNVKKLFYSIS